MLKPNQGSEWTAFLASNFTQNSALQGWQLKVTSLFHSLLSRILAFSVVVGNYILCRIQPHPKLKGCFIFVSTGKNFSPFTFNIIIEFGFMPASYYLFPFVHLLYIPYSFVSCLIFNQLKYFNYTINLLCQLIDYTFFRNLRDYNMPVDLLYSNINDYLYHFPKNSKTLEYYASNTLSFLCVLLSLI